MPETEQEIQQRHERLERFTEIFVVVKMGVYMQNVYGPFATPASARGIAVGLALSDHDNYHEYSVRRLTRGVLHDHEYCRFTKDTAGELIDAE